MAQDLNKEVEYFLSIGFPAATRRETFTLGELGIAEDWTDAQVEEFLEEDYREWGDNYINSGWNWQ